MKVLVTGSQGYIGSVMCKLLKEANVEYVEGCDIVNRDNNPYASTWILDAADPLVAERVINLGIDHIFHFAASADIADSVTRPALFYHNNLGTTTKLLDNLIQKGWRGKFIFSSTAAVYNITDTIVNEDDPALLGPPNPYGMSKLMCEQAINTICTNHGIFAVMFRYFNVAGAWDDVGDHANASHIIPKLCDAVYSNNVFTINGSDYKTRDGTCVRDYVHVRDVCRAHLHAANYLEENPGIYTFNLGTSKGTTNHEMINAFSRFTGQQVQYKVGPRRPGDPQHLVADANKFVDKTNFKYEHSNLEQMITSSWEWYKKQRGES